MGRIYAGVLGPLAFCTVIVRGLRGAEGAESTLGSAAIALAVFSAAGYLIGQTAQWVVEESVQEKIEAELAAEDERGG